MVLLPAEDMQKLEHLNKSGRGNAKKLEEENNCQIEAIANLETDLDKTRQKLKSVENDLQKAKNDAGLE